LDLRLAFYSQHESFKLSLGSRIAQIVPKAPVPALGPSRKRPDVTL
jgi:hypothetical protein